MASGRKGSTMPLALPCPAPCSAAPPAPSGAAPPSGLPAPAPRPAWPAAAPFAPWPARWPAASSSADAALLPAEAGSRGHVIAEWRLTATGLSHTGQAPAKARGDSCNSEPKAVFAPPLVGAPCPEPCCSAGLNTSSGTARCPCPSAAAPAQPLIARLRHTL